MTIQDLSPQFDPLLLDFWNTLTPETLADYAQPDNCGVASDQLLTYLESRGIHTAERIPAGLGHRDQKTQGWFRLDQPDLRPQAFQPAELAAVAAQGGNPHKLRDRQAWVSAQNLTDEFRWIPHSWVELRGRILDPSGFLPNGRGQFQRGKFRTRIPPGAQLDDWYKYF